MDVEDYIPLSLKQLMLNFKNETGKKINFIYGGDGKLLEEITSDYHPFYNGIFYPIRNYGNCEEHTLDKIFDKLTENNFKFLKEKINNAREIPVLEINSKPINTCAVSEIVIKSFNPTKCLRLNVSVNSKPVYKNAICDGIIASTDLIGSHGYFKSITRTTFKNGIGFAFINPTYGLTNCILDKNDIISIEIIRPTEITISTDLKFYKNVFGENYIITIRYNPHIKARIAGYDDFMCYKCRMNRNSTERINDYYI